MTLDEINITIRHIIRTELGLPLHSVMAANENQPTGTAPFATVLIKGTNSYGWDEVVMRSPGSGVNLDEISQGYRTMQVSVQFFRDGALTLCERLRARLQFNSALEQFAANGLGLISRSGVRVLSSVVNTFWEERAQMDIVVSVIAKEESVIATYGEFPISVSTETDTVAVIVFEP